MPWKNDKWENQWPPMSNAAPNRAVSPKMSFLIKFLCLGSGASTVKNNNSFGQ
jgi:hypothetical protein